MNVYTKDPRMQRRVWQLLANKKPARKIGGKKEGWHLPASEEEDVVSHRLMPEYSGRQMRAINRRSRSGKRQMAKSAKSAWRSA